MHLPKISLKPALAIGLLCLCACDPGYVNYYYVDNESSHDVLVSFPDRYTGDMVELFVDAESRESILEAEGLGRANDWGDNFLRFFDSALVILPKDTSLVLIKDYNLRKNWDLQIEGGNKYSDGGTATYTFKIEESNIEIK